MKTFLMLLLFSCNIAKAQHSTDTIYFEYNAAEELTRSVIHSKKGSENRFTIKSNTIIDSIVFVAKEKQRGTKKVKPKNTDFLSTKLLTDFGALFCTISTKRIVILVKKRNKYDQFIVNEILTFGNAE
ncbi:hypothetical protein [Flavobacterium sp.]|uniref:hypothetical protein n=1 Tax=Flavobacterium sp. TaxID=239 RepID=UPI00260ABF53|nr:hypothetical protein [Flavobacterium sp.]